MLYKLIGDPHLWQYPAWGGSSAGALNDRARHQMAVMRRLAALEPDAHLVVAGDVFNAWDPDPQLLAATREVLSLNAGTTLLVGNHDQWSSALGDHALGPLADEGWGNNEAHHGSVDVLEAPVGLVIGDEGHLLCCPFRDHPMDWLGPQVAAMCGTLAPQGLRALVLHCGIISASTPPWLKDASNAVTLAFLAQLCNQHNISLVVAGDWHEFAEFSICEERTRVIQIGTLLPHSFADAASSQPYGRVVIWDSATGDLRIVEVAGPRFVRATLSDLQEKLDAITADEQDGLLRTYVSLSHRPDEAPAAAWAMDQLVQAGRVHHWRSDVNQAEVKLAGRAAGVAARKTTSTLQAVDAYVDKMTLPSGLKVHEVKRRVRELLKEA